MNQLQRRQCSQQMSLSLTLQISQVADYIEYLDKIKQAITKNETTRLNELLEQQTLNPASVEQAQAEQKNILSEYGYELSENGLNSCIQNCDNAPQLLILKDELSDKLKKLEKFLLINALLVRKSQDRVSQSIRLLSGHQQSNIPTTYSRQGNAYNSIENKRSLAQA